MFPPSFVTQDVLLLVTCMSFLKHRLLNTHRLVCVVWVSFKGVFSYFFCKCVIVRCLRKQQNVLSLVFPNSVVCVQRGIHKLAAIQ